MGLASHLNQGLHDFNIRRAEFAEIIVSLYEVATGREIGGRTTFADTNNAYIEKAAYLGAITGVGNNRASPHTNVTREQAAVMLSRLASTIGIVLPMQTPDFHDNTSISVWALEAVGQMQAANLIVPLADGTFGPDEYFTHAQAAAAALWLYDIYTLGFRRVVADLSVQRLTDEQLAEKVENGSIPADVTHLNLRMNQISDISPLATLTHLVLLDLGTNRIDDLSPLASLTNLYSLSLSSNPATDLSPLTYLDGLTELFVTHNRFTSALPISNLVNLTTLHFGYNPSFSGNLQFLEPLTNLEFLSVACSGGRLFGFDVIGSLVNLQGLAIQGSRRLTDISFIDNLTNLTSLILTGATSVDDFSPVSRQYGLTYLNMSFNRMSDLTPLGLEGLTNLTHLILSHNSIVDISSLSNLIYLTDLQLGSNYIADISVIGYLTNLTVLSLRGNHITDITPLGGLNELLFLYLENNQITDIAIVSGLTNLIHLDISNNKITTIPPLTELRRLSSINLNNNQITDITPFADMERLRFLDLVGNNITDVIRLAI